MFIIKDDNTCLIKIYKNNDWVWHTFTLRQTDLKYIQKHFDISKSTAPVLKKKNRRYYLSFSFKQNVSLSKDNSIVCAVDLGINHDAVCSILDSKGTVLERKFINFQREKDSLNRIRKQIKEKQSQGNKKLKKLWKFHDNYNHQLSILVSKEIINFSIEHNCDCIVFEFLNFKNKKSNQKIALWRKREIQKVSERLAHKNGIRFSRVTAINTSKLAFDGTGTVIRENSNYSLCTFQTGKQYNCDLNASYNIGARFFIKQKLNKLNHKKTSVVLAKVPELQKRTLCCLDTLIKLNVVLQA